MEHMMSMDGLRQALDLRGQAADVRYYHNAKALLKIYRSILWQLQHNLSDADLESLDMGYGHIHQALDLLASGLEDEQGLVNLQSQCKNMLFTRALISLTDRALIALKQYPAGGERLFDLLNRLYILEYPYSETELLESMDISRRTFYRAKKTALSMFGTILWGYMLPAILSGIDDTQMALNWHLNGTTSAPFCD